MNRNFKFGALIAIVIGTLGWLAVGGVKDSSSYYKTIAELQKLRPEDRAKRLRVAGNVENGSIAKQGTEVRFTLVEENRNLKVRYTGTETLPDTFRDGAQALADGHMGEDGVFVASKISAKCASKYEAKPGKNYDKQQLINKQPVS